MVETIQQQLENAHQLKAQGQLDAAIAAYQNITQLEPHNHLSYNPLGAIFLEQGKYDEAEKVYRQAIDLNGENAWWHCNLGRSLLNQGKIEAAIPCLQKAIELDSEIAEFYFHLGTAFGKQDDFEQATISYRKAVDLEPDKFLYYHQLGDSLLLQGKYEDAVSPYRKAIELNAEYAWSYHNLGKALSELERWEEAIAVYQKATERWPENPDFHYGLGRVSILVGNVEEGIAAYSAAFQLSPDKISHLDSQDLRNLAVYEYAIKNHPEIPKLHHEMAKILNNLGEHDEALIASKRVEYVQTISNPNAVHNIIKNKNNNFKLQNHNRDISKKADSASNNQRLYENIAQICKQVEKHQDMPLLLYYVILILRSLGYFDLALAISSQAVQSNPQDPSLYSAFALVLEDLGNHNEAFIANRVANSLKPEKEI